MRLGKNREGLATVSAGCDWAYAYFIFDDFVFTNTSNPGETGTYINATLNVDVSGSFGNPVDSRTDNESFSLQYYRWSYWSYAGAFDRDGPLNYTGSMFNGLSDYTSVDGTFSLTLNSIEVGKPITLGLKATVMANCSVGSASADSCTNSADFGNSVTFASDQPVFDLPSGYTVNCPTGNIVNNIVVPEPATLSLLALSGLAVSRRRHRRS